MSQKTLQCFREYVSIKLHFNSGTFIWNKGSGQKITESTLYKRKDFAFFDKLAYQIQDPEERREYFVSCFLLNPDMWIGEVFETEIKQFHRSRMRKINSLEYTFKSDVENIADYMREKGVSIKQLLLTHGHVPMIIDDQMHIIGGVSDETLAILDKAFLYTS